MTKANLTRAGIANLDVLEAKDFGATSFVKAYGFSHACISPLCVFIGCVITR
ncbi:hypothetical protein D3C87_2065910 [compost metagenome]